MDPVAPAVVGAVLRKENQVYKSPLLLLYLGIVGFVGCPSSVLAWGNGQSGNATTNQPSECAIPPYSTHDWVAENALELLPDPEAAWLIPHRTLYRLGTEAPDNNDIPDSCGAPNNGYDTVQLAVSKLLVFGVLSYMLYLSAKNFMSHKHNAAVNKHRQDALVTYRALVEAADGAGNRDVVLTYAAACIFGPQSTGYVAEGGDSSAAPRSVVELLSRQFSGSE